MQFSAPGAHADWQSPSSVVQYMPLPHWLEEKHLVIEGLLDAARLLLDCEMELLCEERLELELRGWQYILVQAMPPCVHTHVLQPSGPMKLSPSIRPPQVLAFRSLWHLREQPSPLRRLPSSQVSRYSTRPLPHQ